MLSFVIYLFFLLSLLQKKEPKKKSRLLKNCLSVRSFG